MGRDANVYCGGGSSPLARGLRRRRIARSASRRDHPRSRGVYARDSTSRSRCRGSSPLARGLPRGFIWMSSTCWDHPRSRGVYYLVVAGSAPRVGIIPARAGFTTANQISHVRVKDHPRSRGVYTGTAGDDACLGGSSPLARGLRLDLHLRVRVVRIIPARAGFTCREDSLELLDRDHPRSRGVYARADAASTAASGSSPLARGLHPLERLEAARLRIIPARAGFTHTALDAHRCGADHPRSRGVYPGPPCQNTSPNGSSPLARGLRPAYQGGLPVGRIIPARAGFTERRTRTRGTPRDHPRSRGVYSSQAVSAATTWGSSPLARGLREST